MAIMLPTVPFRIAVIFAATVGVAIFNSIAVAGCDLDKPLPPWRRRLVEWSSTFFCGMMLRAAGFWWPRVRGLEHWEAAKKSGAVSVGGEGGGGGGCSGASADGLLPGCCCGLLLLPSSHSIEHRHNTSSPNPK
jgi:hypothetical protein